MVAVLAMALADGCVELTLQLYPVRHHLSVNMTELMRTVGDVSAYLQVIVAAQR